MADRGGRARGTYDDDAVSLTGERRRWPLSPRGVKLGLTPRTTERPSRLERAILPAHTLHTSAIAVPEVPGHLPHTRREFCLHSCQVISLAGLGALLEACGGSSPTSPSPTSSVPSLSTISAGVTNGTVVLTIDGSSPLATVGGAVLVETSAGNLLVARTAQDAFMALTATCTHEGCTVTGYQNQIFTCPCHGSQYSTGGQVLRGPAPRPLSQFATQFANGRLTIVL